MRTCSKNEKGCIFSGPQPLKEFERDAQKSSGYRNECRTCRATQRQKLYKANPDRWRERQILRHYGLTLAQYHAMQAAQNNSCAICKKDRSEFKKAFAVDHCHVTGEVRGLLCNNCNRCLGLLGDSVSTLSSAIMYLTAVKFKVSVA